MSRTNRLHDSNAALTEAADEINSGVIGADEIYGTIHGLGCDWETLMVVHVDEVSFATKRHAFASVVRVVLPVASVSPPHSNCTFADLQLHNSHLASRSLPYAQKADLSIPYLLRPTRESLDSAVNTRAQICGAEVVSDVTDKSGKTVVLLEVSNDHGSFINH